MSSLLKPHFSMPAQSAMTTAPNELGVPCYFGRKGLARHYLLNGWAAAEDTHHWNDGYDATMTLVLDAQPAGRLDIRVEGRPYVTTAVPRQDIEIYFNGLRLGFWRLYGFEDALIEAKIEPEFWFNRDGISLGTCVFHIPESRRPRDLGEAADDRRLGFCFQSFTLTAPVPKLSHWS